MESLDRELATACCDWKLRDEGGSAILLLCMESQSSRSQVGAFLFPFSDLCPIFSVYVPPFPSEPVYLYSNIHI